MSSLIAIVGPSGSGKSSSIAALNPKETVIINVAKKPLPFKGSRGLYNDSKIISEGGNYIETRDPGLICKVIQTVDQKRPDIKTLIIEDAQYLMAFEFMARAKETGYNKFNSIAEAGYLPVEAARDAKRDDLNIIFIYHDELADGVRKIKTSGKMIDSHINLEGLFTVVLFTEVKKGEDKSEYLFITNGDSSSTTKSPKGMFDSMAIPNDLQLVIDKVSAYYN